MDATTSLSVDDALAFLGALAARNRHLLRGAVGIAVAGHGRYTLDPAVDEVITHAWDDGVPAAMLVNERALLALVAGTLDPTAVDDENLCVWTGDAAALLALAEAIAPAADTSPWRTRLKSSSSSKATPEQGTARRTRAKR